MNRGIDTEHKQEDKQRALSIRANKGILSTATSRESQKEQTQGNIVKKIRTREQEHNQRAM